MIDRLVWIDLEMTGLDPARDVILEIATLITDSELQPVAEGLDIVVHQPREALDGMVDVVRDMHAKSGLTDAVLASTVSLAEAEAAVLDLVRAHVPEPRAVPLCGNSIATDRTFIVAHMPALDAWLHYRMIDVSSIKELARRWYPKAYHHAPQKAGGHRALADIQESVEELRYYRSAIFAPPPSAPADNSAAEPPAVP
ncbi:MAG TPA: oligoribonuclease [Mycobacteriales bacterium]|jgi:oligoribonuclease|nr:oligoribonuclease [Mycobacteriales bacterium]